MEEQETLRTREKGDIYWKKLKYFLLAQEERGISPDSERYGKKTCEEILAADGEDVMTAIRENRLRISGNEFKRRPPTATGERNVKGSVLLVIKSVEYFRQLLRDFDKSTADETERVTASRLSKLIPVMERALDTWFLANGVDRAVQKAASRDRVEAAAKALPEAIYTYESNVKEFRRDVARVVIRKLEKELPAECFAKPDIRLELADLFEAHQQEYRRNQKTVDRAVAEYNALRRKEVSAMGLFPAMERLVEERGAFTRVARIMTLTEALRGWQVYMEEQLAAAVYAEDGCLALIRWLLAGEEAHPLAANYVQNHFQISIPTTSPNEKAVVIPEKPFDRKIVLETTEDILRTAGEIREYVASHRRLFHHQTIGMLLRGMEDIPEVRAKALAVRNRIARGVSQKEFGSRTEEEKGQLKEDFIMAETVMRVCGRILVYRRECEGKTIGELVASYGRDLNSFHLPFLEREYRHSLEIFIKHKGVE